jgi:hypothetical protein
VTYFATIETFNCFQILTIVADSSAATSSAIIALATATATAISIMMVSFIIFSFSIILFAWYLSSHLCNDLLLLICLPLLTVHVQLIFQIFESPRLFAKF